MILFSFIPFPEKLSKHAINFWHEMRLFFLVAQCLKALCLVPDEILLDWSQAFTKIVGAILKMREREGGLCGSGWGSWGRFEKLALLLCGALFPFFPSFFYQILYTSKDVSNFQTFLFNANKSDWGWRWCGLKILHSY